ncbi:MAG TPA: hypothetical protein VN851_08795 [Thermoanaerobaculia bacterium]|nr:hypothetical protein [Thermoanaerobaculia bacterium]
MSATPCEFCGYSVPLAVSVCPHCGQPCRFASNVRAALFPEEKEALDRRYRKAKMEAEGRGCRQVLTAFEAAVRGSQSVISRPLREADRLAVSERELYSTYYQQVHAEHRSPSSDDWDRRRRIADEALFPGYKESIRFAALTLDGEGVASYGGDEPDGFCFLVLRSEMIAQRATVFEDNSTLVYERHGSPLPPGLRAAWEDRGKLAVAKLSDSFTADTLEERFPGILLQQASTSEGERFVEVHIWGPMSVRTVERVLLKPQRSLRKAFVRELAGRLRRFGVVLEER